MKTERTEIWEIDSLGFFLIGKAEVIHREQHIYVVSGSLQ